MKAIEDEPKKSLKKKKFNKVKELKEGGAEEDPEDKYELKSEVIDRIEEGRYFGEISLITNLKRTCTIKTSVYSTIAYIHKDHFDEIKYEFPQVYMNIKKGILGYKDKDFEF